MMRFFLPLLAGLVLALAPLSSFAAGEELLPEEKVAFTLGGIAGLSALCHEGADLKRAYQLMEGLKKEISSQYQLKRKLNMGRSPDLAAWMHALDGHFYKGAGAELMLAVDQDELKCHDGVKIRLDQLKKMNLQMKTKLKPAAEIEKEESQKEGSE